MGHRAPRRGAPRASAIPPPPPDEEGPQTATRLVPMHTESDLIRVAREEYAVGRIELDEFERALDHIVAGGRGNAEFPYLPMFDAPAYEPLPLTGIFGG